MLSAAVLVLVLVWVLIRVLMLVWVWVWVRVVLPRTTLPAVSMVRGLGPARRRGVGGRGDLSRPARLLGEGVAPFFRVGGSEVRPGPWGGGNRRRRDGLLRGRTLLLGRGRRR